MNTGVSFRDRGAGAVCGRGALRGSGVTAHGARALKKKNSAK
jgi:hypothetical protein